MNIEAIKKHINSLSAEAKMDWSVGEHDEAMTNAACSAAEAKTPAQIRRTIATAKSWAEYVISRR